MSITKSLTRDDQLSVQTRVKNVKTDHKCSNGGRDRRPEGVRGREQVNYRNFPHLKISAPETGFINNGL